MNKLILGLLVAVFSTQAQAFNAQSCGEEYKSAYEWSKENNGDWSLTKFMYGGETYNFYSNDGENHVAGVGYYGFSLIGSPFIFVLDTLVFSPAASLKRSFLKKMKDSILKPESKNGLKGIKKMYKMVKGKISITKEQFSDYFNNDFNKANLCQIRNNLVLTERGQEMVGDQGLLIFLSEARGTPLWDEFWNDPRNHTGRLELAISTKEEIKGALIESLVDAGFQRK